MPPAGNPAGSPEPGAFFTPSGTVTVPRFQPITPQVPLPGPGANATPPVETVPISRLFCSPTNPRKNDAAIPHVAASLRRFGWQQPIVARRTGQPRRNALERIEQILDQLNLNELRSRFAC